MSLILSGTDGLSDVDGSAATPAIRGTDANTGIFFGADIIGFAEGGAEVARFNADAQFVAAAGTASLPVITTTGDVNTGIFFPAADTIAFAEGGAEAMRIESDGDVGIGTSSPAARLQVSKAGVEIARFTNTQSNGADYEFKLGGGGFEDRKFMLTDKFSGADNVRTFVDSSGNFAFNSGYGSAAIAYGCRAWCQYNGSRTIVGSANITSITVNGTGDSTLNFTTAMPDANYSAVATTNEDGGTAKFCNATQPSTANIRVVTFTLAGATTNNTYNFVAVFR